MAFLLDSSLISPSETGVQSDSARALTRGANDSIASPFASVRWDTRKRREEYMRKEGPYLAVFQDKAETSSDRFEWTEGIRGVSHPTQEQFGRGRRSRFPVGFFLIRTTARFSVPAGTKNFWSTIGGGRGVYVV